jgi:hypothetical protein
MTALKPANALRIAALLGIFNAASATAQVPAYLVINNTDQTLTCSTRVPNGLWQDWFEIPPGANWVGPRGAAELQFQCRPPVAQFSYSLRPQQRYTLLSSGPEIRLVEVVQGR